MWYWYPVWVYYPTYTYPCHYGCGRCAPPVWHGVCPPPCRCHRVDTCNVTVSQVKVQVKVQDKDPDRFAQSLVDAFKNVAPPHSPK